MGFAEILALLFQLAPSVVQTVQAIEGAAPHPGNGPKKRATVLKVVEAAANVAPVVCADASAVKRGLDQKDVAAVTAGVAHIVDHTVSLLNEVGAFQKAGIVRNAPGFPSSVSG